MSAVNPKRLAAQVEDLLTLLDDPQAFCRQCLDLLEFYASRTRKPVTMTNLEETLRVFNVPRPVIRALSTGLSKHTQARSHLAWPAAAALWETGYRETRLLSSAILGGQPTEEVAQMAEAFASDCDDDVVLFELADRGLVGWRYGAAPKFLEKVAIWIESPRRRLRVFALMAIRAAVDDSEFAELPTVFRILSGRVESARGDERRSLYALVRSLAKRSPPETVRFLLDEMAKDGPSSRRMVRNTWESFPLRQRQLLERALSTENRTGIMPLS
jgi:hypothetical protein